MKTDRYYFLEWYKFWLNKEYTQAIECFNEAISLNSNFGAAHFLKGLSLFYSGDSAGAIDSHSEAIKAIPKFVDAYCARALAFYSLGRKDKAVKDYKKALEIHPNPGKHFSIKLSAANVDNESKEDAENFPKTLDELFNKEAPFIKMELSGEVAKNIESAEADC